MAQNSSFSKLFDKENDLLADYYAQDKQFIKFRFQTKIFEGLKFSTNLIQILQTNQQPTQNRGEINLKLIRDQIKFKQILDTQGNINIFLNSSAFENSNVFVRFQSNHLEGTDNRQIGYSKNYDNFAMKSKFNYDKSLFELITKVSYQNAQEVSGLGMGLAFNYKTKQPSLYKFLLWNMNDSYSMKLLHQIKEKNEMGFSKLTYSLWKKLNEKIQVSLQVVYDMKQVNRYNMLFGCKLIHSEKVDVRAKLDDEFNFSSSFNIQFNDKINFVISNKIDLNLRQKNIGLNYCPVGFELNIKE